MRNKLLYIIGWLIITIIAVSLYAQTRTLTGTVTATNDTPIPGATITAKNNSAAVATDANGKFTIRVPDNTVITVSAIGYKTQTINISGEQNLKVKLAEDVSR